MTPEPAYTSARSTSHGTHQASLMPFGPRSEDTRGHEGTASFRPYVRSRRGGRIRHKLFKVFQSAFQFPGRWMRYEESIRLTLGQAGRRCLLSVLENVMFTHSNFGVDENGRTLDGFQRGPESFVAYTLSSDDRPGACQAIPIWSRCATYLTRNSVHQLVPDTRIWSAANFDRRNAAVAGKN